jgi:hypothetical protein
VAEIGNSWGQSSWAPDTWADGAWQNYETFVPGRGVKAIDVLDKPTCAGGVIKPNGRIVDCLKRVATFTLTGEDELVVEVPASSATASLLTSRNIARVHFADLPDHFHEWRFRDDEVVITRKGGRVQAKAYDLVNDLAAPGPIRSVDPASGIATFDFRVEATATELLDAYLIPRLVAKGYTWIARGTVEFSEKRLWEWQRLNPLELLRYICSVRGHEYRLRQNGITNYLIDIAETINANAPQVEIRPGINLTTFKRSRKGASHFTVLEGSGVTGGDGQRATIARAAWRVDAIDTANNRLTLTDPSGVGDGPIIEDDQFVHTGPAPGYVFRYERGGTHRITDSFYATQQVQLDSVAGYAVGDLVELRSSAGVTEVADGWQGALWAAKRVTNVDAGTKRLTVDDPFADIDVVLFDDRYRGWTVRPYFRAASSAMSANVASGNNRQCTVGSTTGMLAGDLVYHTASNPSGAPNWGLSTNAAYEVVSVDSATLVTIKHRRKSGAIGSLSNTFLSAWRARSDRVCTACAAAGDTIDVDSVTSIVTGDIVECVRKYDAAVLTELASPSGVAASGIRVGTLERPTRGEVNLLATRNPFFADFTAGPNAAPDHWHVSTGARLFGLKNTDPTYLNTGVNSVRLAPKGIAIAGGISAGATSATLGAGGGSGHRFQVGESVILGVGTGDVETVVLTSVSADGLTIGFAPCVNNHLADFVVHGVAGVLPSNPPGSDLNGLVLKVPFDVPSVGSLVTYTLRVPLYLKGLATNDTVQVRLRTTSHPELGGSNVALTLTLTVGSTATADSWNVAVVPIQQPIPGGALVVEVATGTSAGNYPQDKEVFVGAIGLFQTAYDPGMIPRYSFATELHQATNTKLALVSSGAPASFDLGVVDLYGLDPRTWPQFQYIIGGMARTTEPAAGAIGLPLRILKLTLDYDRLSDARAEVGTKQQRLTKILANASVPVPVVRINTDGSTDVLTSASQQQLSFPTIGSVPRPVVTELFVIQDA